MIGPMTYERTAGENFMEALDVKTLIIAHQAQEATALTRSFLPHIDLVSNDFTTSLRKAMLSFAEEDYEVCFIFDKFSDDDLRAFFKDLNEVGKLEKCLVILVRETLPDDFDPAELQKQGFHGVISSRGTHADITTLTSFMKERFLVKEIRRRKFSVKEMVSMLLKDIDRTASDIRRGFSHKLIAIPMDGIEVDVEFNPEILDSYFEQLMVETEGAKPRTIDKLNIPEDVLQRALPGLSKEGYVGASHRVWEFLAERYGIPMSEEGTTSTQEDAPTEVAEGQRTIIDPD